MVTATLLLVALTVIALAILKIENSATGTVISYQASVERFAAKLSASATRAALSEEFRIRQKFTSRYKSGSKSLICSAGAALSVERVELSIAFSDCSSLVSSPIAFNGSGVPDRVPPSRLTPFSAITS
jgi:hypothetical protein